nr:hypothetical protein [Candidatus Acidoferrales bacterium]
MTPGAVALDSAAFSNGEMTGLMVLVKPPAAASASKLTVHSGLEVLPLHVTHEGSAAVKGSCGVDPSAPTGMYVYFPDAAAGVRILGERVMDAGSEKLSMSTKKNSLSLMMRPPALAP